MKPLELIIDALAKRIDYILKNPPYTHCVGKETVTTFDGKDYKNLTAAQVDNLRSCAYSGTFREWKNAVGYHRYLEHHFTPSADYYLREMRKHLI